MTNDILGHLREARAALLEACDDKPDSRQMAETLTNTETAIMWALEDLRLKEPTVNECDDGISKEGIYRDTQGTMHTIVTGCDPEAGWWYRIGVTAVLALGCSSHFDAREVAIERIEKGLKK